MVEQKKYRRGSCNNHQKRRLNCAPAAGGLAILVAFCAQNAALAILPGLPFLPKSPPFELPDPQRERDPQKEQPTERPRDQKELPAEIPKDIPKENPKEAPRDNPKNEPLPPTEAMPRSHERPWIDARPDLPL